MESQGIACRDEHDGCYLDCCNLVEASTRPVQAVPSNATHAVHLYANHSPFMVPCLGASQAAWPAKRANRTSETRPKVVHAARATSAFALLGPAQWMVQRRPATSNMLRVLGADDSRCMEPP